MPLVAKRQNLPNTKSKLDQPARRQKHLPKRLTQYFQLVLWTVKQDNFGHHDIGEAPHLALFTSAQQRRPRVLRRVLGVCV